LVKVLAFRLRRRPFVVVLVFSLQRFNRLTFQRAHEFSSITRETIRR
jgi:hypothetical protein